MVPFDSTLFLSVVSSECLRVDNEMQVFELTALWLMALDSELDLQDGIGTGPASISADLLDLASAVPTLNHPTRIAIHGASLLQHIRFAKIPLARLNEWFERVGFDGIHNLCECRQGLHYFIFVSPCAVTAPRVRFARGDWRRCCQRGVRRR